MKKLVRRTVVVTYDKSWRYFPVRNKLSCCEGSRITRRGGTTGTLGQRVRIPLGAWVDMQSNINCEVVFGCNQARRQKTHMNVWWHVLCRLSIGTKCEASSQCHAPGIFTQAVVPTEYDRCDPEPGSSLWRSEKTYDPVGNRSRSLGRPTRSMVTTKTELLRLRIYKVVQRKNYLHRSSPMKADGQLKTYSAVIQKHIGMLLRRLVHDVLRDRSTFNFIFKQSCVECVTMIKDYCYPSKRRYLSNNTA